MIIPFCSIGLVLTFRLVSLDVSSPWFYPPPLPFQVDAGIDYYRPSFPVIPKVKAILRPLVSGYSCGAAL